MKSIYNEKLRKRLVANFQNRSVERGIPNGEITYALQYDLQNMFIALSRRISTDELFGTSKDWSNINR